MPTGYMLSFYSDRITEFLPMHNYILDVSQSLLCKILQSPPSYYYHYITKMNPLPSDITTILFHLTNHPTFNQKQIKYIPNPPPPVN